MSDLFVFFSPNSYTLNDFHGRLAKAGLAPVLQLRDRVGGRDQIFAGPDAMWLWEDRNVLSDEIPGLEMLVMAAIGPATGWSVHVRSGQFQIFAPFCMACIDDPSIVVPIEARIAFGPEFCKLVRANPIDAFDLGIS